MYERYKEETLWNPNTEFAAVVEDRGDNFFCVECFTHAVGPIGISEIYVLKNFDRNSTKWSSRNWKKWAMCRSPERSSFRQFFRSFDQFWSWSCRRSISFSRMLPTTFSCRILPASRHVVSAFKADRSFPGKIVHYGHVYPDHPWRTLQSPNGGGGGAATEIEEGEW